MLSNVKNQDQGQDQVATTEAQLDQDATNATNMGTFPEIALKPALNLSVITVINSVIFPETAITKVTPILFRSLKKETKQLFQLWCRWTFLKRLP